ncbi:MAG: hypothetical protein OEZ58_22795 [Gammaproteobacteria bacterium]|nr:hypothetical protein [Gammaproteobacteria bacterium]MDH5731821.1 hypothetical protein [Gammaproteobacteria bacterium]
MLKKSILLFCLSVFIILATNSAFASETLGLFKTVLSSISISPGVGVASPTLRVKRKSDDWEGDISGSPGTFNFNLNVAFNDVDIPGTRWGASLHVNAGSFTGNRQFVYAGKDDEGKDEFKLKNLGTQVNGLFSYFVPIVYYKPEDDANRMKIGGGIGYGAVSFKADPILAKNRDPALASEQVKLSATAEDAFTFVAFGSFLTKANYNVRVAIATTIFNDANYKYSFDEFRLTVSKTFFLF